ncbi:D-alanyl-D-alanine carboxypeptidase family protein [Sporosarcina siberiensis]|uniref:D-alanyl-D-alanine carboxypeptidase family protein n=1 Tax=Sporosarcina siberiensis TaxID=1365606 RepID=A0ABW4SGY7_9BACL
MKRKRKNKHKFRSTKKKSSKKLTIVLFITALLMTGLVVWVAINDWDIEKSFGDIGIQLGLIENKAVEPEPEVEIPLVDDDNAGDLDEDLPVEEPSISDENGEDSKPAPVVDGGGYIEGQELPLQPTYIKNILIANKKYPLPATFAPGESKEAREMFDKMAAEAALSGYKLSAFSTYRSFEYQTGLYNRYVDKEGPEKADRYSARPGYSEHQTGLAFDIGEVNQEKLWLTAEFGESAAGKWLAENAHRYGFIMRYPLGKEDITGYMYESWHFRYVGESIASEIYAEKGTLEEYLES